MGGKGSGRQAVVKGRVASAGSARSKYAVVIAKEIAEGRSVVDPKTFTKGGIIHRRAAAMALRVAGFTQKEIAKQLGSTEDAVRQMLYRMRVEGELNETDAELDHDIVPAAIAQAKKWVDEGDKESVFTILKGRGKLKTHAAQPAGVGAGQVVTNLVVSFQVPEGKEKPVLVGQVVGVPREKQDDEP